MKWKKLSKRRLIVPLERKEVSETTDRQPRRALVFHGRERPALFSEVSAIIRGSCRDEIRLGRSSRRFKWNGNEGEAEASGVPFIGLQWATAFLVACLKRAVSVFFY